MRLVSFLFILSTLTSCMTRIDVDLIIHNAQIHSVDEQFSVYQAMAIRGDSIVEIGPEHQILNKYSSENILDASKKFIYPGLIDGHCHFLGYAKYLNRLNLVGCESKEDMFKKVEEFSAQVKGDWVVGRGWDQNDWDDKSFPDKLILDEKFPNKYVILKRIDGHAVLVNQKVLDLAGIHTESVIEGGMIELIDGQLSGILIDNAVDLVSDLIPEPKGNELKELVLEAQKNCFEKGLTTVSDAGLDYEEIELIREWQKDQKLKMKVYAMLNPSKENFDFYLSKGPVVSRDMSITSFKFYADGALGSRGASLIEEYSDDPHNHGLILTPIDSLKKYSKLIYSAGFQMNTHAIGDNANRVMTSIYGEALGGTNDRRWRIEHAQVIHDDDFSIFREYNILPSVQPTHATSDSPWAIDRLGSERIHGAYAYKKLKDQNGLITLGTDFPVESIDPLLTLLAAVSRTNSEGEPKGGYLNDQALSFEEAIRGMTIWAAIANFEENQKGSLEASKKADFIVFNRDLKLLEASNFHEYKVEKTFVNGELVYETD